ncbi:MAG: DUF5395 family protein [Desulfobacterales bacterium]|nr:DUF5395 family protein [Desulfobacterales bacterium]
MRIDSEWCLSISGRQWIARENGLSVSGMTLDELEANIKDALMRSGRYARKKTVTVFMGVDTKTLPAWIRPYQSHYFNRYIRFKM